MNIIPAIDFKNGKVVKAFAGFRVNYKPFIENTKDYSDPFFYIKFLVDELNINTIYIADLDSICGSKKNWYLLKNIILKYSSISFWIDAGFSSPAKLRKFDIFLGNTSNLSIKWKAVIGTETLFNERFLYTFMNKGKSIISLDFNGTENKWFKKLYYNSDIILMFVNRVGGRGVDWEKLEKFSRFIPPKKSYIAGGIRYSGDLYQIKRKGYKGVILSSLIHKNLFNIKELILGTRCVPRI